MSERTVLASFLSAHDANLAATKIHDQLGVEVAKVDELHGSGGLEPQTSSFPISGDIPSLASLTLDTQPKSRDAGVLLATDPSASGMSDAEDNMANRNYLLTVVCQDTQVEQVVQIIKDCNGFT